MGEALNLKGWIDLGRLADKGYAVAVTRIGNGYHVRAVRSERVIEAESPTMAEAILDVYEKTKARRQVESRG